MTKKIINMEQTQNLFQEFDAVTTKDWVDAIEKFLKGKPVDSLNWEIEEGLIMSPLHRKETTTSQYIGSPNLSGNNNWSICEAFIINKAEDCTKTNAQILEALSKGSNALILNFNYFPKVVDLEILLQNVLLDLVQIHFQGTALATNPKAFLQTIAQLSNVQTLNGSCDLGNITASALVDHFDFCLTNLPTFRCLNISIADSLTTSLSAAIFKASQWIDVLTEQGRSIEQITNFLRFEFNVGEHYFVELAAIRAFKRLWFALLEAYNVPSVVLPFFHATTLSDQHENQYWNMITATTQAMAAAIGGVDCIYIRPCNTLNQADSFTRRIARNVQHVLQSESYLNRVIDPASGAYYIENLTLALSKKAWQQFCNL
ncbi:MAG: Methylmalonyl-CoA mutase (EC [uncultured Aureispira sp.]|uniref:Methylmalonyl-CoA mutase (EC) n=1 Tax=uncultured Aureispira sp. TaxID=1331704 RepID=A0A6S6TYB0_9BACT|nr:MAG: Methylmalonyl-CoA mutase (EC [uncultured Aureispira sp.]